MKIQILSIAVVLVALILYSCNRQDTVTNPGSDQGSALEKGAPGPIIVSNSPASAEICGLITITGSSFGPKQNSGYWVKINGIPATVYQLWSKNRIEVIVPSGSVPNSSGQVTVYAGTHSSNAVQFTLLPSSPVTIGTQIWMGANLDVATYRNGDPIPQVTDPAAMAQCYNRRMVLLQ